MTIGKLLSFIDKDFVQTVVASIGVIFLALFMAKVCALGRRGDD